MEILGHSEISLTLDTCSQVLPSLSADAAAKIGSHMYLASLPC
jgi:hypothetical protein